MTKEDEHLHSVNLLKDVISIKEILSKNAYKNDLIGDTYVIDKELFDVYFVTLMKEVEIVVKNNYQINVLSARQYSEKSQLTKHRNNEIINLIEIIKQ